MRRSSLKITATLAGLGLVSLSGRVTAQPGGNPATAAGRGASTTQAASPSPGQVGPIGGNIGAGNNQGLTQGTPGGAPATSGIGAGGANYRPGATTAGTSGSYGRFVTQPFSGARTPSMFGNTPGMFGNGATGTTNGMEPAPLGGEPRPFGNTSQGTSMGNLPGGALPYGTPGAPSIYPNAYGTPTYYGGSGGFGNYQGNYGNYANNDSGYRGYSSYYGNNNGYGLSSGPLGTVGASGQPLGNNSASMFQNSAEFQQLNNGMYNNGRSYNGTYYYAAPYGETAGPYGANIYAPGGQGVGVQGYPNPLTSGPYPPSIPYNAAANSYAPQAYTYGMEPAPTPTPSTYGWF